jgi:acetyltransferase-like isoleucine patch superfamily enzyme
MKLNLFAVKSFNALMKIFNVLLNIFEDLIRNFSGPLGIIIRRFYYSKKLGFCGKNIVIETGVFLMNSKSIFIGDNVWIDKNCILIAGDLIKKKQTTNFIENGHYSKRPGELHLGNNIHIGLGNIIQSHAGVLIGDYFTSSANCCIYSYSNDYKKCKLGTIENNNSDSVYYNSRSIVIGTNVWIGIGVSVLSANIENDVFVMPHSTVSSDLKNNSVYAGCPAKFKFKRF